MNSISKGFAAEGAPEEWSVELELCGSVKFWAKPKAAITIHFVYISYAGLYSMAIVR